MNTNLIDMPAMRIAMPISLSATAASHCDQQLSGYGIGGGKAVVRVRVLAPIAGAPKGSVVAAGATATGAFPGLRAWSPPI